jgi:hypothetical protein
VSEVTINEPESPLLLNSPPETATWLLNVILKVLLPWHEVE